MLPESYHKTQKVSDFECKHKIHAIFLWPAGQKVICACLYATLEPSPRHWRSSVVVSSGAYLQTSVQNLCLSKEPLDLGAAIQCKTLCCSKVQMVVFETLF